MSSHRNAHETRPGVVLKRLTSPIPMSLCKGLEASVFRCQELLSNLCQLRRHLFSPCHMETLHLKRQSCRFLQRHHFNAFQEERERPRRRVWKTPKLLNLRHHSQFLSHVRCPARLQFHPRRPRILLPRLKFHPRCSRTLLLRTLTRKPVVAHDHFPTQFERNQQLTRSPMIHSSLTILLCPHL